MSVLKKSGFAQKMLKYDFKRKSKIYEPGKQRRQQFYMKTTVKEIFLGA
jgi:hypothetical protein